MSNLEIWKKHADIDPKMTKGITGKDYKGTSPNAHHVIWCLTDLFGPVGQGFGWSVVQDGIERFDETAIHWCRIQFWHTDRANTFEAYGQTKIAYTTRNGDRKVDEDAPKKSLTDAITKAAAQIGIAANIFLGRWDDNKYVQGVASEFASAEKQKTDLATFNRVKAAIQNATDSAKLDAIWKHKATKDAFSGMTAPQQAELQKAYTDRMAEVFQEHVNNELEWN